MSTAKPIRETPFFNIIDLATGDITPSGVSVSRYLNHIHENRFHNAIHAETRVYTCDAWSQDPNQIPYHQPRWDQTIIPNETFLDSVGWIASTGLVKQIESRLANGRAVYLFIYNSDADLIFVEVMTPPTV